MDSCFIAGIDNVVSYKIKVGIYENLLKCDYEFHVRSVAYTQHHSQ